jgi:Fe2+-dicitrate sensor, membrane component
MSITRLQYLTERCLLQQATSEERSELMNLLADPENESIAKQVIQETYTRGNASVDMQPETATAVFEAIIQADKEPGKLVRKKFIGWAVAASFLAVAGIVLFFLLQNDPPPVVADNSSNDIEAPSANRAMIALADGRRILLESLDSGQLATQGNVSLIKLANGRIAYKMTNGQTVTELQYNTLINPKGSKVIHMTLADGSRVWLNAGSSITYPVAFTGNERKVELNGEGYFEVAKDPSKKFIVAANGATTEVLGTHFNVMAYDNETKVKVTLLEGVVEVYGLAYKGKTLLRPGQQAALTDTYPGIALTRPDLEQVMAWKEGVFTFNDLSFEEVMRKVERWYDVTVVYTNEVPKISLQGNLSANTSLRGTLEAIKFQGVNVELRGRTITIN